MNFTDIRSPNLARRTVLRKPAARSSDGIVVSHNRRASCVGAEVLRAGGSAVDAAIATSFAIGVLEPWMSGIGGVGAMLVRPAGGPVTAIDAGARAPATLDPADFPLIEGKDGDLFGWPSVLEDRNVIGAKAICIPGLLRGLAVAHARFGRLPWADLVAPAIEIAREGVTVDAHVTLWIAQEMARLGRNPACAAWFLPNGLPPSAPAAVSGRMLRLANPALVATLEAIAAGGAAAFYEGPVAAALAEDVQAAGGYLSTSDLAGFAAVESPAAVQPYRDREVHFVPELNGGVTVAQALRSLGSSAAFSAPVPAPAEVLASAEALSAAWAYRFAHLGDGAERSLPSCTTHFSVVDRDGMSVSLTQTLLSLFGSAVVSPQTGVLLNNGVNWFDPRPARVNCIGPSKKALANYSPMMMTGPEGETLAIGGSGGRKILPAVYQAMIHIADYGYDLERAIAAPRYDLSAPPVLVADARLGRATIETLAQTFEVAVADRQDHPNSFTTLGATLRRGGINEGMAEPWHLWAEAVVEGEMLMPIAAERGDI